MALVNSTPPSIDRRIRDKTTNVVNFVFDNSRDLERTDLIQHLVEVEKSIAIERAIVVKELERILTQGNT
jgi:hypothetical protein